METKEWLTATEVASLTGVTPNRVYNWRKEGRIPPELIRETRQGFRKRIYFHRSILKKILGKEGESHE